jgi:hypothetical protein
LDSVGESGKRALLGCRPCYGRSSMTWSLERALDGYRPLTLLEKFGRRAFVGCRPWKIHGNLERVL